MQIENIMNKTNQIVNIPNTIILGETKKIVEDTFGFINKRVNKAEPIDTNELIEFFKKIIGNVENYNNDLNDWFDAEFYMDKENIIKKIFESDNEYKNFLDKNMIVICEDDSDDSDDESSDKK